MYTLLGIVIGVLILVVVFLVAAQSELNQKIKAVEVRQGNISRELLIAKQGFDSEMVIAGRKAGDNDRVISETKDRVESFLKGLRDYQTVLRRLIRKLGYIVEFDEVKITKINMKGENYGEGKEREETVSSRTKKKES